MEQIDLLREELSVNKTPVLLTNRKKTVGIIGRYFRQLGTAPAVTYFNQLGWKQATEQQLMIEIFFRPSCSSRSAWLGEKEQEIKTFLKEQKISRTKLREYCFRATRLNFLSYVTGRPITSANDLTDGELLRPTAQCGRCSSSKTSCCCSPTIRVT